MDSYGKSIHCMVHASPATVVLLVMLGLIVLRNRLFQHRLGLWRPTRTVSVQATLANR